MGAIPCIPCWLDGFRYLLFEAEVVGVISSSEVRLAPYAPSGVCGVAVAFGSSLAVIDPFARRFEPAPLQVVGLFPEVDSHELVAFTADRVEGALFVPRTLIEAARFDEERGLPFVEFAGERFFLPACRGGGEVR